MCRDLKSAVERRKWSFEASMGRVIETAAIRAGPDDIEWEYRVVVPKVGILEIGNDLAPVVQKAIDRRA